MADSGAGAGKVQYEPKYCTVLECKETLKQCLEYVKRENQLTWKDSHQPNLGPFEHQNINSHGLKHIE